jgi:hypothetical protein
VEIEVVKVVVLSWSFVCLFCFSHECGKVERVFRKEKKTTTTNKQQTTHETGSKNTTPLG